MPTGHALGGHLLQHLGDQRAELVERGDVLEQRHHPALHDQGDQRDGRDLQGLRELRRGVHVDLAEQEPALELVGEHLQVGDQRALSGAWVGE